MSAHAVKCVVWFVVVMNYCRTRKVSTCKHVLYDSLCLCVDLRSCVSETPKSKVYGKKSSAFVSVYLL